MSETIYHQFKLRLPVDLFRQLEAVADDANRSVSAEIINRLEASFAPQEGVAPDVLNQIVSKVIDTTLNVYEAKLIDAGLLPNHSGSAKSLSTPPRLLPATGAATDAETLIRSNRMRELDSVKSEIQSLVQKAHSLSVAGNEGGEYQAIKARLAQLRELESHLGFDLENLRDSVELRKQIRELAQESEPARPPRAKQTKGK